MTDPAVDPPEREGLSSPQTLLMALACGVIVANIYYAQPLVALIGPEIGLAEGAASLTVTLTQLGYGLGLLLLVPLGDRLENRRLVVGTVAAGVLALVATGFSRSGTAFLVAAFAVGVTSTSVQMLVPIAAHLAPAARRGQVVGNVMSGLILGILLARPAASLVAHHVGWRAVFFASAAANAILGVLLWLSLPSRRPRPSGSYGRLVASLWPILRDTPVLRRRAFYQGCLFAAFTLFWTAVPLRLADPLGYSQDGIALFALCGAAGAAAAPLAGRLADRGYGEAATLAAMLMLLAAFGLAWFGRDSVALLVAAAIVLDGGVQLNQITSQRAIYSLGEAERSRLNGLYMALFFMGGAVGSAVVSPILVRTGWGGIAVAGVATVLPALAAFLIAGKRRA